MKLKEVYVTDVQVIDRDKHKIKLSLEFSTIGQNAEDLKSIFSDQLGSAPGYDIEFKLVD